ncbi:MAG: sulfatase-like hydrolase/transferase, partial [Planctomycetota bacterium]
MAGEQDSGGGLDRRSFLKAGLAAAAAGAGGCVGTDRAAWGGVALAASRKRNGLNVIQIILHDTGQAFGCYGMEVKTPHVDAFAAEGVRFSNHFCNSTPCSPARGCVMTGQYAHHNGLIGLVNKGWDIPDGVPTVVDHFNDAGYETVLCGLQHERHPRKGNAMHYRKRFSTRG